MLCATGWSPVDQALLEGSNHGPQLHAGSGEFLFGSRQILLQLQLCLWGTAVGKRGKREEEREERGGEGRRGQEGEERKEGEEREEREGREEEGRRGKEREGEGRRGEREVGENVNMIDGATGIGCELLCSITCHLTFAPETAVSQALGWSADTFCSIT